MPVLNKKISRKKVLTVGAMTGLAGIGLAALTEDLLAGPCGNPASGDMATRNQFKYVDSSTTAGQSCKNCIQFTGSGNCGKCNVVQGPISASGWCTVWAKKA